MSRLKGFVAAIGIGAALVGCSGADESNIVTANEKMISIITSRLSDPIDVATAHCAKFGRVVKSRGGVEIGDPVYKIMWGYDCVKPGEN